jgi:hypothetical protein
MGLHIMLRIVYANFPLSKLAETGQDGQKQIKEPSISIVHMFHY